jgi:hypothetical protein
MWHSYEKLALGQVFLQVLRFLPPNLFLPILHCLTSYPEPVQCGLNANTFGHIQRRELHK